MRKPTIDYRNGEILVPTDVHDLSQKAIVLSLLILKNGKEGAESNEENVRKKAYVKHETQVRGIRAATGM